MMRVSLPRRIGAPGAIALAVLASACSHSPATTMLTIDALPPPPSAPQTGYRGSPIAIPAVHVPAALDRVDYVSQPAPGTARLDDFAQWIAPLGTLARDALVRDLTARLPAGAVLPPGATGGKGVRVLDVTILTFVAGSDGAVLQVAYRTLPSGTVRQVELRTAGDSSGATAGARALAALIAQLADRIALEASTIALSPGG